MGPPSRLVIQLWIGTYEIGYVVRNLVQWKMEPNLLNTEENTEKLLNTDQ